MVFTRLNSEVQRLRLSSAQNAKDHARLLRLLEGAQPARDDLLALASHFYERDQALAAGLARCADLTKAVRPELLREMRTQLRTLKQDLLSTQQQLHHQARLLDRTTMRVTLVVEEFRTRCRGDYTEHLKNLDLDLRKILKPLVPTKVLDEQVRFKRINNNPSMQSSMQSTLKSELRDAQEDVDGTGEVDPHEQEAKLNAHIELLVNTLETVAKDLIGLCSDVNRRYYEVMDPRELLSGPPTPLAAPLPEYFSFKAADYIEDQLDLLNIDVQAISDSQRQDLIEKLMQLNKESPQYLLHPDKADKLRQKLEHLGRHKGEKLNLEALFRDEALLAEREKMVYSLIHSERRSHRDVTLDELIGAPNEERRKIQRKASEESGLPPPVDKCERRSEVPPLTDNSYEEAVRSTPDPPAGNYYTPPADALRKPQGFFELHRKSLPPITMLDKKTNHGKSAHGMKVTSAAKLTREDRSSKDVRVRSVTPVHSKRSHPEKKPGPQTKKPSKSPTPGVRKLSKKQSLC